MDDRPREVAGDTTASASERATAVVHRRGAAAEHADRRWRRNVCELGGELEAVSVDDLPTGAVRHLGAQASSAV
jgi:hypothetical protein